MSYTRSLLTLAGCVALLALAVWSDAEEGDRGFLENPPVFIDNEPDIPLALMGTQIPEPGQKIPGYDSLKMTSSEFRQNGVNVQPGLHIRFDVRRISLLTGIKPGWGAAAILPWQHTRIDNTIGGFPATRDITDLGDFALLAKRRVWHGPNDSFVTITGGLQFPTGNSTLEFEQSNAATNGYYRNFPRRVPVGWDPGTGAVNGYLGAAYSTSRGRLSYAGLLAAKLHSTGDEDVKIGDVFVAGATGTYGIAKPAAFSLSVVLRTQADDSYPQAPPPGVEGAILRGTTTHGTTLYLNPSIRFTIADLLVVGVGVRYPAILPENGFVPDTQSFLIIYPNIRGL